MKGIQKKKFSFPLWSKYFAYKEQLTLFVIVLLGLSVRIINAARTPLWRDEIYLLFTARDNSFWKLLTQHHWDTAHPPLSFILLHFWQKISVQPLWLRFPSIIASFFILYLTPILAVKITKKIKVFPFVFLLLFSLSHTQISLGMVVRPYPFVLLFVLASLTLFFEMVKKYSPTNRTLYLFVLVNFFAIQADYSAIWLFVVYLFAYLLFCFKKDVKKAHRLYVFKALFYSALSCLVLVPLLIANLSNSLYLERYNSPVVSNEKSYKQGTNLYIQFLPGKHEFSYYDQDFHKIKTIRLPSQSFQKKELHVGFDLPPLTALDINTFEVCKGSADEDIQTATTKCHFTSFLDKIRLNSLYFFPGSIRILRLPPRGAFIVNTKSQQWIAHVDKRVVNFTNQEQIMIKMSFSSYYYSDYPGIYIYENPDVESPLWWKYVRVNVSSPDGEYRIAYYGGSSQAPKIVLNTQTLFERFAGDALFFSGFPNTLSHPIILGAYIFFTIPFLFIIFMWIRDKNYNYGFITLLYIVPLALSYLISCYIAPIFLGRNLYMSNVAYLASVSLLIAIMLKTKKRFPQFLGGIVVLCYLFIFASAFPLLHYVDPPYTMNGIFQNIKKSTAKQKLIVIKDFNQYPPLLRYAFLTAKFAQKIPILSFESFNQTEVGKKIPTSSLEYNDGIIGKSMVSPGAKPDRSIFFIKFGSLAENEVSGGEFTDLESYFGCNLSEVKFPYVYFAECK